MAIYYPYNVQCSCGNIITLKLARTVNAGRSPEIKQQIIDGEFHKCSCTACGVIVTVEKEFSYVDFTTKTFIKIKPRQEKYFWKQASKELLSEVEKIPEGLVDKKDMHIRVVFGLAELRDKIIASDYYLDDRLLEILKVLLIYDHPVLTDKPRLKISVDKINVNSISFNAAYELDNKKRYRLSIPRWVIDPFIIDPEKAANWINTSHKSSSIYQAKEDKWISIQRWAPAVSVLNSLRNYAKSVKDGEDINTTSLEFKNMLIYLPKGDQLPSWAKQDIKVLFMYAKQKGFQLLEQQLLEIRFDKKLSDEWALNNDPEDMDTIYKLFLKLPETNVEGNIFIDEIILDSNMSGSGVYDPNTKDIYISSEVLSQQEFFEDTVRHEVGHAVHERFKNQVDTWLKQRFGWQAFDTDTLSIDQWIDLMGGWGNVDVAARNQIVTYLVSALGYGSSWNPGALPVIPVDHPWRVSNFGPRLAFEQTGAYWYNNFDRWFQFDNKAFFLNYWYQKFYVVNISTLDLIAKMPSSYASMSDFEFFAELYSLYYDEDDPNRSVVPADVRQWLEINIGKLNTEEHIVPATVPIRNFNWQKK
jgi:hypothetical protein